MRVAKVVAENVRTQVYVNPTVANLNTGFNDKRSLMRNKSDIVEQDAKLYREGTKTVPGEIVFCWILSMK